MKRVVVIVVALALLLAACAPPAPPPPPPVPQGFDTCAAPSTSTMRTWAITSPYTSVGIYIGGANRGCSQPNLTPSWINTVTGYGWRLLPIWVGAQAPCTPLTHTTTISYDHNSATNQGILEGMAASDRAAALGLPWLAPIYFDMEAYPSGGACTQAVLAFTIGWTYALHQRGYLAGYYSSLCSGITDVANAIPVMPRQYLIDAVWIAAWSDVPNIFGFNQPGCALWDVWWSNHGRVHQFRGGHDEVWGGVGITMDTNAVDGPTYPW